jgi:hypothetical protein
MLHLRNIVEKFLVAFFRFIECFFKLRKAADMKLIENFHLQSPQSLTPSLELSLDMNLEFFFLRPVFIEELPVIMLIADFS